MRDIWRIDRTAYLFTEFATGRDAPEEHTPPVPINQEFLLIVGTGIRELEFQQDFPAYLRGQNVDEVSEFEHSISVMNTRRRF